MPAKAQSAWKSRPWGAPTGACPNTCNPNGCGSGPCPRKPNPRGNRAHGALLQVHGRTTVGAGHAREGPTRVEIAPMGRSYRCMPERLWERAMPAIKPSPCGNRAHGALLQALSNKSCHDSSDAVPQFQQAENWPSFSSPHLRHFHGVVGLSSAIASLISCAARS
jgi:hypothetical protein